jgi:hypothetical protein
MLADDLEDRRSLRSPWAPALGRPLSLPALGRPRGPALSLLIGIDGRQLALDPFEFLVDVPLFWTALSRALRRRLPSFLMLAFSNSVCSARPPSVEANQRTLLPPPLTPPFPASKSMVGHTVIIAG